MSILRDFYSGRVPYPWERKAPANHEKHTELAKQTGDIERSIVEKLDDSDREKWQEMKAMLSELEELAEADLFSYSFSMGAFFMLDVLTEAKSFMGCNNEDDMLRVFRELFSRLTSEEKQTVTELLKKLGRDGGA